MDYTDRFKDKVAIVTGSAGGIGEAYARAFAEQGAAVVIADIDTDGAAKVAASIDDNGGRVIATEVDVSQPASAEAMVAAGVEAFGGVDILVNNAAIYGTMKIDGLASVDWDYYKHFMAVNFDGVLVCTRAVRRTMRKRGGGVILNQSSTAAYLYSMFYGVAKAGVNALTNQLAVELGGQGIRVNAIAPGPIDTAATRTVTPGTIADDMAAGLPIARMGQPADLVGMALFLCSDEASWITGQIVHVDGGQILKP
ncbi:MAG TPA: SDR family oxidoreductase [Acidimicrobiales bacterium]|nr:SDR family oxidoreductase [Acidimicrobiales bacterium]